ncbi:recombinase family protein [Bacillus pumilus]|uniref:recombinase family protein n=1 Tax=Bacillus pumilus TaxID=1408 RepID=UPI00119DF324|nr:recombinase family protein [Bacillus pumilus]
MYFQKETPNEIIKYDDYPYKVYTRVSTDRDEQISSKENQIDVCRYWIEQHNYEWDDRCVLLDDGISGTVLEDRAAMKYIFSLAEKKEIKMVIFKSITRLARDLKDALYIREILVSNGVRVVTLEEDYDSLYESKASMKFEMSALFAEQLPKSMSVNISGVLAAKARRGEHSGRVPYGYMKEGKHLVINENEAQVIRLIFHLYNNEGLGHKRVTYALQEKCKLGEIPPPKKRSNWQLTTVQTILRNPIYCGVHIANRHTTIKVDGRKKFIRNPPEKWTVYEDFCPPIISREDWEKANNKLTVNKKTKFTPWNELRQLLICGKCGSNMVIIQTSRAKQNGEKTYWKYVKCSNYRRAGQEGCVNHVPITYEEVRDLVIENLIEFSKDISHDYRKNAIEQKEKQMKSVKVELKSLETQNKRLLELYLEDQIISKAEFQIKRNEIQSNIIKLEQSLFSLQQVHDEKSSMMEMQAVLRELEDKEKDLKLVFDKLIDHIVIHPNGKMNFHYRFK